MNREEMLKRVQMLSFVLTDVNLFLDTHPTNAAALNFYNKYNLLYKQALDEYQTTFGPIVPSGVNIKDGWTWIDEPWPWEMED